MTATMRGTTSDETTRANARASAANTTMKNAVCICSRIMCWTVAAGVLSVDGGARLMVLLHGEHPVTSIRSAPLLGDPRPRVCAEDAVGGFDRERKGNAARHFDLEFVWRMATHPPLLALMKELTGPDPGRARPDRTLREPEVKQRLRTRWARCGGQSW